MKLPSSSGVKPHAVLQRNADGTAEIGGEARPVGGPDRPDGVLVGDLWVLAGQSNMEGVGLLQGTEEPHPLVRSYGSREVWGSATEPLHDLSVSPRAVHARLMAEAGYSPPGAAERKQGAGLGLSFARARAEQSGVPIGLIPSAHGGTSMQQWSPDGRGDPQNSLYGAMLDRVRQCGGKVAGVLWYQGESDTGPADWPRYEDRMTDLLTSLRLDLDQPSLPFLMVQLGRFVSAATPEEVQGWNEVRDAQRRWASRQQKVQIVAAIDLGLDDAIHIDTAGLKRLGRRLARAADGHGGLTPARLVAITTPVSTPGLRLTVAGVNGELRSSGLPRGFSLRDAGGQDLGRIYRTELDGDSVLLYLSEALPEKGVTLWYGWGLDPVCTVTDAADQALLTFAWPLDSQHTS